MRQTFSGFPQRLVDNRDDIAGPGIGTNVSGPYGLFLQNLTPAVASTQQYSPPIVLTGNGHATTPVFGQRTDFKIYNQPVQGTTAPTANLLIDYAVNGGAFATKFTFNSVGDLTCAGFYSFSGRSILKSSANGLLELFNAAGTDFTRLNFGGTTSSFPGIGRNGIGLEILGADGAGPSFLAVYNTKTSSTNYERFDLQWTANVAQIWTEKGSGGGTARALVLGADATELMRFGSSTTLSFFAAAAVVKQTGGQNVTNNVTNTSSTDGSIPDITDGAVYANDYTNLRDGLYQLARLVKQDHDALRAYGLLT